MLIFHQELRYLLSTCTDEVISAPKIWQFSQLPSLNENSERESNLLSQLLYLHSSGSVLLVNFTDSNKQLLNAKPGLRFFNHE